MEQRNVAIDPNIMYFLNDVLSDTTSLFSENNILGNDLSIALEKSCET